MLFQLAQKNGNGPLWHIFTISTFGFGMDCYYFIHNSHWPSRANSLIARSIYGWISSVPPKLCKHSGLWNSARVPWYHNFGVMVLVWISWQTLALKTHDSNLIFGKIHFLSDPRYQSFMRPSHLSQLCQFIVIAAAAFMAECDIWQWRR